jgi:hypothetical protein
MTAVLAPQVGWEERNDLGEPVLGVTTVKLANPSGGWLLWGSQDRPERGSQDRAEPSDYRPLDMSFTLEQQEERPEIEAFEREYAAFLTLLPHLESRFRELFVAVHRGSVVDSDTSRSDLVKRFFARFGDVPVYIGYVGQPAVGYQLTPFQIY